MCKCGRGKEFIRIFICNVMIYVQYIHTYYSLVFSLVLFFPGGVKSKDDDGIL